MKEWGLASGEPVMHYGPADLVPQKDASRLHRGGRVSLGSGALCLQQGWLFLEWECWQAEGMPASSLGWAACLSSAGLRHGPWAAAPESQSPLTGQSHYPRHIHTASPLRPPSGGGFGTLDICYLLLLFPE